MDPEKAAQQHLVTTLVNTIKAQNNLIQHYQELLKLGPQPLPADLSEQKPAQRAN
jgi:hypothetical protein